MVALASPVIWQWLIRATDRESDDIFALKMGLACNRQVEDATIERLQKALDKLIQEGMQDKINTKYKNS